MINFRAYPNMTKCVIPDGVTLTNTNFYNTFSNMQNLQEITFSSDINSLSHTCNNCTNLTKVTFGNIVSDLSYAFASTSLTEAICGPNVTNMSYAYSRCVNLTKAVCGPNVNNFTYTYKDCTNLTEAVCGPNVKDMKWAYLGCKNLKTAVCGYNVINLYSAYWNATNIQGNAYIYSPNVNNAVGVFGGRNASNMLNIYVPINSTTLAHFQKADTTSIVEANITWTNNTSNDYFYNTQYNIYIYPVENVAAAREANGD